MAEASGGTNAIELIEEALHLLRRAPASVLSFYYIGALPFVLAFLFFWADMSSDAFAWQHVTERSLAVALLFVWMSFWQTVYATALRRQLGGEAGPPWTLRRILRAALAQAAVQPTSLLAMPASLLLAVPFASTYGFYQNFTLFGDGRELRLRPAIARAAAQAGLRGRQSWLILAIEAAFALIVFLNVAIAIFVIPELLRLFSGAETAFTMSGIHLLSSTFFAVCLGLTYLCVDPLMKAIYVLRCFYGESLRSGEDLKAEFRAVTAASAVLLLLALLAPQAAHAGASATELDHAIDKVIHQPQYAWRLPRQHEPEDDARKNPFIRFTESVLRMMRRALRQVRGWANRLLEWLFDRRRGLFDVGEPGANPSARLRRWVYVLLAALAVALAILLWRTRRRSTTRAIPATPIAVAAIDLHDEASAAELPEERWRSLAEEWIARNDLRMALRALYLASLSHLAQRELIRLHRAKSNRDYQRELVRRARAMPDLLGAFAENLAVFERSWYGKHHVERAALDGFLDNLDRMKTCAG